MEQYIPKSALVAEIEKRYNECLKRAKIIDSDYWNAKADAYRNVLEILKDTLEVKEVDLDYIKDELDRVVKIYKPDGDFGWGTLYNVATHFFELGLKAQYNSISIPNIDDILEENSIDPNSKDAKILKECYYMALEKLKAHKL